MNTTRAFMERQLKDGFLPPAYLLWGDDEVEKEITIQWFLKKMLGVQSTTNPNFFELVPEGEHGGLISLAAVRTLRQRAAEKPVGDAGHNLFLLRSIERLSSDAAPALLKLLEEPPKNSMFLATTLNRSVLLRTIRSRFVSLRFFRNYQQVAFTHISDIKLLSYSKRFQKVPVMIENETLSLLIREAIVDRCKKFRTEKEIDSQALDVLGRLVAAQGALQNSTVNKRLVGEYAMMLL